MSKKQHVIAYSTETTIVVKTGNLIVEPGPIVTFPSGPATWFVTNNDTEKHVVSIDFKKFTDKNKGKKGHPFKKDDVLSVLVKPGETRPLTATVKDIFLSKIENFKYEIESASADGMSIRCLDPDLDVIDPNPIHPK